MASLIGEKKSFKDRGYIYTKPSRLECIEMGWHRGHCAMDIVAEFERVKAAASWIKSELFWQDYVLFPEGEVYFKHERDLIMFKLKFG